MSISHTPTPHTRPQPLSDEAFHRPLSGEDFELSEPGSGFQLPLSGLYADLDAGEGSLNFSDDFLGAPGLVQLEVIRDWRIALEQQHRRALVQLYHELTAEVHDAPTPEKLRRFRAHCQRLGIECPDDMAILLQRF